MPRHMAPSTLLSCILAAVALVGTAAVSRAEKIGKVNQGLVAGTEVSAQEQQDNALVRVKSRSGGCSGSLLNSEWVISAAHCFLKPDVTAGDVTITAKWPTRQTRTGKELHILAKDIAIVRVDSPFDNVKVDYNMPAFTGTMTPGRSIKVFGRGINVLAAGVGDAATPTMADGKYRSADFQIISVDGDHFWFGPGKNGAIPAGGDSGGPAFISAGGQMMLAGISSECHTESVAGKPVKDDDWTWVNKIIDCGYAPVAEVWPVILQHIGSPACRNYAWRAVGTVKLATELYKCAPATISGPRFSPNFDDHLNFCKSARAADANFEDKERFRISQECRIAAAMPHGSVALTVAHVGDGFNLSGGGYEVNSRVIIRSTDSAGSKKNITSNFSDAKGNFSATVRSADVCSKEGTITFTAEDQDKPASPPVKDQCDVQKVGGGAPPPVAPPANVPPPNPPQIGGRTATALVPTMVYQNHTDEHPPEICEMGANDSGKLLETAPDNPLWLHLSKISGACGGRAGWVWKGDNGEEVSVK